MNHTGRLLRIISGISWSPPMLLLFSACGIILTLKTGFIQLKAPALLYKKFFLKGSISKTGHDPTKLSAWEALSSALAGTVGTGNIAGVTLALICGGAGAIFWLWISAFLGMATKYTEILLSIKYRALQSDGSFRGGPMHYIEKCLGKSWRPAAVSFAIFGAAASIGIGNLAQCKEIADAVKSLFSLSPALSGFLLTAAIAYILSGGVKRIGKLSAVLVPVMSILYLLATIWIVAANIHDVPEVLCMIFNQAFSPRSIAGGATGHSVILAMQQGFARGVFSNEAGLGSSPMAHAASECSRAEDQAILGVFEVFISSIVFCTLTALAVLLSGSFDPNTPISSGGDITAAAFDAVLPFGAGSFVIRISLIFFAFSSLISWSYYGRCCVDYLSGDSEYAERIYKFVFALCCTFGAIIPANIIWDISDTLNGFMALPNIIALIAISLRIRL